MPVPTAGVYRLGATVAIEAAPMGDDTRQLLNAHHAAILRELDEIKQSVRGDLSEIRSDLAGARTRLETHDRHLSVLQWAYGIGAALAAAVLAKIGFGSQ